jgi:hypothetical protein
MMYHSIGCTLYGVEDVQRINAECDSLERSEASQWKIERNKILKNREQVDHYPVHAELTYTS